MIKLGTFSEQSEYKVMTGQQIFDKLQWAAHIHGPGSVEFLYGNLLFEAMRLHGEEQLFTLLEEAEMTGKKVDLHYPSSDDGMEFAAAVIVLR